MRLEELNLAKQALNKETDIVGLLRSVRLLHKAFNSLIGKEKLNKLQDESKKFKLDHPKTRIEASDIPISIIQREHANSLMMDQLQEISSSFELDKISSV